MKNCIHIGIIGNFKGHLNGAEKVAEYDLPNGIFIIDNHDEDTFTDGAKIRYPIRGSHVDIEPEFVIRYAIDYCCGKVSGLNPLALTIGNDFTIRVLPGSTKISQRKSWGRFSKGLNSTWWAVPTKIDDTNMARIKLVSYIEREGLFYRTTPIVDTRETKIFGPSLIEWVIDRINHQPNFDFYQAILPTLEKENFPKELVLYTGAPNYTEWGDVNFLQIGDIVHIAAYDSAQMEIADVTERLFGHQHQNSDTMLSFMQKII